jgi:tetratricopeptide (TPR) repeat protein
MTSPGGEFRFNRVMVGRYWLAIDGEKFQPVRYRLEVDVRTFGVVNVAIPLRPLVTTNRSPEEETVSVEMLRKPPPRNAVNAYNKALDEQRKGKSKEAVENFQKSIALAPDFFDPHLQLGLHYARSGDKPAAVKLLERAVELNSSTLSGRTALGRLYFETSEYQRAADMLSAAVKLPAAAAEAYFYLGSAYYRLEEMDLAEENLLRVLTLANTVSGAHLQLYNVYMKMRKPVKALAQLDAYLAKFPEAKDRALVEEQAAKLRAALKR